MGYIEEREGIVGDKYGNEPVGDEEDRVIAWIRESNVDRCWEVHSKTI